MDENFKMGRKIMNAKVKFLFIPVIVFAVLLSFGASSTKAGEFTGGILFSQYGSGLEFKYTLSDKLYIFGTYDPLKVRWDILEADVQSLGGGLGLQLPIFSFVDIYGQLGWHDFSVPEPARPDGVNIEKIHDTWSAEAGFIITHKLTEKLSFLLRAGYRYMEPRLRIEDHTARIDDNGIDWRFAMYEDIEYSSFRGVIGFIYRFK